MIRWKLWFTTVYCIVCIIVFIIGIIGISLAPQCYRNKLQKRLILTKNSAAIEEFKKSDYSTYLKFYFFNVTNANEFNAKQSYVPSLVEKGPFVFRVDSKRIIEKWNDEQTLITYRVRKSYHFEPKLSNGSLDEKLTTINIPLVILTEVVRSMTKELGYMFNQNFQGTIKEMQEPLFVEHRIGDLLFDGYKYSLAKNIRELIETEGRMLHLFENDTFGLMFGKNNSFHDLWTVFTGKDDFQKAHSIHLYNNQSNFMCWPSNVCNDFKGTHGAVFPPPIASHHKLYTFSEEIRRSYYSTFEKNSAVNGIDTKRFIVPKSFFMPSNSDEEYECLCSTNERQCTTHGFFDISRCDDLKPILISAPHYYNADEQLLQTANGFHPNKDHHESYFDIDPNSGEVLHETKRFQILLDVKHFRYVPPLDFNYNFLMPIYWTEQTRTMSDEAVNDLKANTIHAYETTRKVYIALIAIGALLLIIPFTVYCIMIYLMRRKISAFRPNYTYSGVGKY